MPSPTLNNSSSNNNNTGVQYNEHSEYDIRNGNNSYTGIIMSTATNNPTVIIYQYF